MPQERWSGTCRGLYRASDLQPTWSFWLCGRHRRRAEKCQDILSLTPSGMKKRHCQILCGPGEKNLNATFLKVPGAIVGRFGHGVPPFHMSASIIHRHVISIVPLTCGYLPSPLHTLLFSPFSDWTSCLSSHSHSLSFDFTAIFPQLFLDLEEFLTTPLSARPTSGGRPCRLSSCLGICVP